MNSSFVLKIYQEIQMIGRPLIEFLENGKKCGVFKEIDIELLSIYSFSPLMQIAKKYFSGEFEFTEQN